MSEGPSRRWAIARELAVCGVLLAALSVYALWKMDYLSPATAEHIRMTDSTRTAYVAKNIAEGRGYTTNELPTFLLNFYEQQGKLHQDRWPNADRFPFTAYAVAALYLVTGSTSEEVGILLYNAICFIGFLVLLYWFTRSVWNDRWAALCTLGIALLHPLTYVLLYMKDADMMLLVSGVMILLYRYFERGAAALTIKRALALGTLLAWLYLARPNIGIGFLGAFGFVILRRLWRERGAHGARAALLDVLRHEGVALAAVIVWCLPYTIHSLSEWGSPMFSANNIYQLPLGTRFAMDTDTWWKYPDPSASTITVSTLIHQVPHELIAKFTTSWLVTLKVILRYYALELSIGLGLIAWLASRAGASTEIVDEATARRESALRKVGLMVGFVVLLNFLVLPLYGYQNYGYWHYLSFYLPLIWICCGKAIVLVATKLRPVLSDAGARVRKSPGVVLLVVVAALLAWNLPTKSQESNELFANTANFIGKHWLGSSLLLGLLLLYAPLRRLRLKPFTVGVIAICILIFARYQPRLETKRLNLNWFPADDAVWDVLRERKGLVMSFAMQGEVNWASDRKNIPAPELMMHVYSLLLDHHLEVEDVYVESAESLVGPYDGAFFYAAPGFESYVRMQTHHGRLPGYQIVFDKSSMKGYPKYRVKPRPKASTVWRLVDRDAVQAMFKSPQKLELGSVDDIVYTAHGWGEYYTLGGRPALAATDETRGRYVGDVPHKAWEDTSVTFFLDDHRPTSVDFEIYGTHKTTLQFYWNLDLYSYDRAEDRKAHLVGTYEVQKLGWQTVHLEIPAGVTRKGLNKLGFRAANFRTVTMCPPDVPDELCAETKPPAVDHADELDVLSLVLRDQNLTAMQPIVTSLFAGSLVFNYAPTPH